MTKLRRPCACRGWIEAEPHPSSIEYAVRTHQRLPAHQDWWEETRLESEKTSGPNVPLGPDSMFYVKRIA